MSTVTNERIQGIAAALAEASRTHGEDTIVSNVLESFGLSLDDLRQAGVEAYDLGEIRQAVASAS